MTDAIFQQLANSLEFRDIVQYTHWTEIQDDGSKLGNTIITHKL